MERPESRHFGRFFVCKKPKTWTEFQKDQWDKVGGAENYTGEDAALFGAGVWLVGTMRWALSKVFG